MLFSNDRNLNQIESIVNRSGVAGDQPFARLFNHLFAYKRMLIGAAVLGLLLTGLALCFFPPRYDAEAVVIIDSRRNKLADAEAALSSIVVDQYQTSLKSELELILSSDLARHVITSLNLLQTPQYASALTHTSTARRFAELRDSLVSQVHSVMGRLGLSAAGSADASAGSVAGASQDAIMENAVALFRKSFWASNDPKSLTIRMGYRSNSPQLSAAVTNAALHRYLEADEETKAAAIDRSQAWLKKRVVDMRGDLNGAEQAVEDFRASHQLATSRDQSPLQQQLLQLSSRLVDAEAELSAAQAKVARSRLGGGNDGVAASSDAIGSRLIQGLRQQEATLLAQQAELGATQAPNHPSMLRIATQLAKLRSALAVEVDRVGQFQGGDVTLAQMRLADLKTQIRTVQDQINIANSAGIRLRSLEADAAAKRAVLNTFTERYDQNAGSPLTPPDSRVVSWATVPVDASSPHYALTLVGGTLGFTFVAFGLSLLTERLRSGFGGMQEVEDELGLVAVGLTPLLPRRRILSRRSGLMPDAPSMREFALTVRALAHAPTVGSRTQVLLVTSAVSGEGKSTVALSLARSVANSGQRCLLVDADIRNPTLHSTLRVPATPGLAELSLDRSPLAAVARPVGGEAFDFLSAGRPTKDTLAPFTDGAFGAAVAEMRRSYDVIVIDSAPVLLASEGLVLSGCADLTLFVVKWRTTPREIARKAVGLITRCSAGPCLSVLSQVNVHRMRGDAAHRIEADYRKAYSLS